MRRHARRGWWAAAAGLLLVAACTGVISEPPSGTGPAASADRLGDPHGLGLSGARRLSREEYRTTILELTGVDVGSEVELLPEDATTPFDNDYTTQIASQALVEAFGALATRVADRVIADPALRDRVVGCTPAGADDPGCYRAFVQRFGRRVLHRPLTPDEVDAFMSLQRFAVSGGDFYAGVRLALRVLLQDLELLYRVEIGETVSGQRNLRRLTAYELAARLSYLLWGAPPDEALLDDAADGRLDSADEIRAAAARLLDDDRARRRISRFHAMWLGYDELQLPTDLADRMRRETDALIERVIFEERGSWLDLFRAEETYVDDVLAEHYGLAATGSTEPRWTGYGETGRRGLLSHGTFLSNGAKFGDTSPVLRGIVVRERLLCQEIPPPPPAVNTDEPPGAASPDACKEERYAMHRTGGCASCHSLMDPVGFGLEAFDEQGRFRAHDDGRPECAIRGEGRLDDLGVFHGPGELSELVIASGELDPCAVRQLWRFATGRGETADDLRTIAQLAERFRDGGHRFDELLLDLVSSDAFRHRRVEEE